MHNAAIAKTCDRPVGTPDTSFEQPAATKERRDRSRRNAVERSREAQSVGQCRSNPAGADRDYSPEEFAYLKAVDAWRQRRGGRFPTVTDFLAISKSVLLPDRAESADSPRRCTAEELVYLQSVDAWRRQHGRYPKFLDCLHILKSLGYVLTPKLEATPKLEVVG